MDSYWGLQEVSYFDSDSFIQLFNNYLGLEQVILSESTEPLYGSSGEKVFVLFIEIFLDEFNEEMVDKIEEIDEETCIVHPSWEFYGTLGYFLGIFFDEVQSKQFAKISSSGSWGVPQHIAVSVVTEHPSSFEEKLGWVARFNRSEFLETYPQSKSASEFFQKAQKLNDEIVDKLIQKYGEL